MLAELGACALPSAVMLIARQKPDATNVAGIHTWNSLGRFVKRGEKGILILAPMIGRKTPTDAIATEVESDNSADERHNPSSSYTGFGPCICSTDYLVICGRASAHPMDAASATLESPSIALSK